MSRTPEFELVAEASKAVHYGLHDVAHKIALVIKNEAWRRFELPTREIVEHLSFAAFVASPAPRGLETDVDTVRRVCRDDATYLDIVDRALQVDQRPGQRTDLVRNAHKVDRPASGTRERSLRRLRKDRPDLHAEVLAGNLTAHAAMIQAGFRRRTITVPVDIERAAQALRRHFDAEELKALRRHLDEVPDV